MPNYIRVKQINPNELSGFFVDSISSQSGLLLGFASGAAYGVASGIILNETVLLTGNQNISGNKTFLNNLNVSGDVTIAGTLRYNEIIDTTVTGNISGYTGIFQQVYASNLVYNTGDQTINGTKTFNTGVVLAYAQGNTPTTLAQAKGIQWLGLGGTNYDQTVYAAYDGFQKIGINFNREGLTNLQDTIIFRPLKIEAFRPIEVSGAVIANNLVYNTGNQNISGNKTFLNNFIVSGTESIFPILQITGVNDILINGNSSFGNYVIIDPYGNHKLFKTNYLRGTGLQNIQISGLKINNIINVFSDDALIPGDDPNILIKSYQYIMVDGPIPNSYNAINITGGLYSGKGLRRFKTGPTIANGYKNIPSLQYGGAIITPKQKYLETVYNITVESGKGAIRPLFFQTPNITTANNPIITLKFNFQADTGVCVVSGRYPDSTPIFTITGANYDFIQTERLMYHAVGGGGGGTYVRI